MKLEKIRSIAKSHSINAVKLSKTELIKSATAYDGTCDQMNCLWRYAVLSPLNQPKGEPS